MILYSKIYGEKHDVPILIFHGLFGMSDNWNNLGKKLSKYYKVYIIDLRNHGNSFHDNDMSYCHISKDILRYINYYNISYPIIIGHSIGGKAIMEFSLNYYNKSRAIIVIDIAPKSYKDNYKDIIYAIKNIDLKKMINRQNIDEYLMRFIPDKNIRLLISKNIYRNKYNNFCFKFYVQGIENNYVNLLKNYTNNGKYNNPTLFLKGERSKYICNDDIFNIKKYFPLAKIIQISNSGHWIQNDNPTQTYYEIKNFIISILKAPQAGFEPATP